MPTIDLLVLFFYNVNFQFNDVSILILLLREKIVIFFILFHIYTIVLFIDLFFFDESESPVSPSTRCLCKYYISIDLFFSFLYINYSLQTLFTICFINKIAF